MWNKLVDYFYQNFVPNGTFGVYPKIRVRSFANVAHLTARWYMLDISFSTNILFLTGHFGFMDFKVICFSNADFGLK
jgi:hypothetical protein